MPHWCHTVGFKKALWNHFIECHVVNSIFRRIGWICDQRLNLRYPSRSDKLKAQASSKKCFNFRFGEAMSEFSEFCTRSKKQYFSFKSKKIPRLQQNSSSSDPANLLYMAFSFREEVLLYFCLNRPSFTERRVHWTHFKRSFCLNISVVSSIAPHS